MTRRVAVIGAGRRVRHNFLPALEALGDGWTIAGITSRGGRSAAEVGDRVGAPAVPTIDALDWGRVDTVLVSVTTTEMPNVLRQLEPYAATRDLIVDTPVFARATHLRHGRQLRAFRRAVVAEDFMRFPQHDLLRAAVAGGGIGTPRRVTLHRTGSLYHGLALGRSFFGFPPVRGWRARVDARGRHVRYDLAGGATLEVIAPYQPDTGVVVVEGDAGALRLGGSDKDAPDSAEVERIERDGRLAGFAVATRAGRVVIEPSVLRRLVEMDLEDPREFNLAKTCGTAAAMAQLDHEATAYGPADALHDTVVSALAAKVPFADFAGVVTRLGWRALGRAGVPDISNADVETQSEAGAGTMRSPGSRGNGLVAREAAAR